jgi:hypothetical protein
MWEAIIKAQFIAMENLCVYSSFDVLCSFGVASASGIPAILVTLIKKT